ARREDDAAWDGPARAQELCGVARALTDGDRVSDEALGAMTAAIPKRLTPRRRIRRRSRSATGLPRRSRPCWKNSTPNDSLSIPSLESLLSTLESPLSKTERGRGWFTGKVHGSCNVWVKSLGKHCSMTRHTPFGCGRFLR